MKRLGPACLIAGAMALLACGPPKYVNYTSTHGDWKASVPWAWNIITDEEGEHFKSTTFIGPFEPEFYLGAPSFIVRWHSYGIAHRLRDGLVESYSSVDDYIKQMLTNVYGPEYQLVSDGDPREPAAVSEILISGRKAKHFVVLSSVLVPPATKWGTSVDSAGRLANLRRHSYAILPLQKGFYVIVYPATRDGYALHIKPFNNLVNTFALLKDGPAGAPLAQSR